MASSKENSGFELSSVYFVRLPSWLRRWSSLARAPWGNLPWMHRQRVSFILRVKITKRSVRWGELGKRFLCTLLKWLQITSKMLMCFCPSFCLCLCRVCLYLDACPCLSSVLYLCRESPCPDVCLYAGVVLYPGLSPYSLSHLEMLTYHLFQHQFCPHFPFLSNFRSTNAITKRSIWPSFPYIHCKPREKRPSGLLGIMVT